MKAIVLSTYGSPDQLELQDVERPSPQGNEVLIRVCAVAVNDWDWCLARGRPIYVRFLHGFVQPKVPILGADIAGYVEAVGPAAKTFEPGDAVYSDLSQCGFGGFAEYVCASESVLTSMPSEMSFPEAASLPHAAALAMQGLIDVGHLQPQHKLLINGAGGGVGTMGAQIAKSIGVKSITGVDHRSKLKSMHAAGFQTCLDYKQVDFTNAVQKYDLILDTKTNRPVFNYLRALKPNGVYATVGGKISNLLQIALLTPKIHKHSTKRIRIVDIKPIKDLGYINNLYNDGFIKPIIDGPYSLAEVPKAMKRFGNGKHLGKIVISVHEPVH